jgi:glycosyltransferase involved in cell wall biosynthesis
VPDVAVNARYAGRPVTGVERYADELVSRLRARLGADCQMLQPHGAAAGVRGHLWEQLVLPADFRGCGADVLISLCNLGPVAVRRQLVVIHDVAPFLLRDAFTPAYGMQVRAVQRALARRGCRIATVSQRSRRDLAAVLDVDPAHVALVPPAVGPPFAADDPGSGGQRCVFVGGHDERKNLGFLLALWPQVHKRCGLELHVVGRSGSATTRAGSTTTTPGVSWHFDPTDAELADQYRSALCVLSPSRYEGFGLPLLEGMACGTPFLASDAGAAAELAVDPDEQVLPLAADVWIQRLEQWATSDPAALRAASLERSRQWSWDSSADALLEAVETVARR